MSSCLLVAVMETTGQAHSYVQAEIILNTCNSRYVCSQLAYSAGSVRNMAALISVDALTENKVIKPLTPRTHPWWTESNGKFLERPQLEPHIRH